MPGKQPHCVPVRYCARAPGINEANIIGLGTIMGKDVSEEARAMALERILEEVRRLPAVDREKLIRELERLKARDEAGEN